MKSNKSKACILFHCVGDDTDIIGVALSQSLFRCTSLYLWASTCCFFICSFIFVLIKNCHLLRCAPRHLCINWTCMRIRMATTTNMHIKQNGTVNCKRMLLSSVLRIVTQRNAAHVPTHCTDDHWKETTSTDNELKIMPTVLMRHVMQSMPYLHWRY